MICIFNFVIVTSHQVQQRMRQRKGIIGCPGLVAATLAILACPMPAVAQGQTGPEEPPANMKTTVYAHVGRGADNGITGGLGFLQVRSRFALGLDFGIEGKQEDQTFGDKSIKNARSFNMLLGLPVFRNETFQIVSFTLLGVRTYKTTCPSGESYLGFQCYADYEPEQHWTVSYGGGVVLDVDPMVVGVRVTGQSVAGIAGVNFNF